MQKYFGIGLSGLILLLGLRWQMHAQTPWTVWLYEAATGRILEVAANGTVLRATRLSLPPNTRLQAVPLIDPTGTRLIYRAEQQFAESLFVLSLPDLQVIAQIPAQAPVLEQTSPDDYFLLREEGFSGDGQHFAFAEIRGGMGWQIQILDLATGEIRQRLSYGDAVTLPFPPLHAGANPQIQALRGDALYFTIAADLRLEQHNYRWFYLGNILSESFAAPNLLGTSLALAGDIIAPLYDERFPAEHETITRPTLQRNSLQVYEMDLQGRYPFFTSRRLDLQGLTFIERGQRLLVEALEAEFRWWLILERDGGELRRLPLASTNVRGTSDGFVYTTRVNQQTALVSVDTVHMANSGETVWLDDGAWQVIWAQLDARADGYRDWSRLAAPTTDPRGLPVVGATPTLLPPYPPLRYVGMEVQVYVPDAGYLNLRDTPNGSVLALLESGTRAMITDGSVEAGGYTWWQIRVGTRTGWVVESLPDSIALIPPQTILEPTAIATP